MPLRLSAFALFILGFLTIVFFRHYTGDLIPNSGIFYLAGFFFLAMGYLLLRYANSRGDSAQLRQLSLIIADLKANGEKISVDLNNCEIRTSDYVHTIDRGNDNLELAMFLVPGGALQALYNLQSPGDGRTVGVVQSVFIFENRNTRTGQTERFLSPIIPKDKISLSFYFDRQRETTLYVDRNDRSRFYFDLDFLAG